MLRFINWYIDKLHLAATEDSTLTIAFLKVVNLMMPPSSLLRPAMARRVWLGNLMRAISVASPSIDTAKQHAASS